MGRGFVEMARIDVCETMNRWHAIQTGNGGPRVVPDLGEGDLREMIDKLVSDNIMLLRAIEEVEARPWWRRRRDNPYAR